MCIKSKPVAATRPHWGPDQSGTPGAGQAARETGSSGFPQPGANPGLARPMKPQPGKRLSSGGQVSTSNLATKVKKVVNYQAGRLENILLPVLVTLGTASGQYQGQIRLDDLKAPKVSQVEMDSTWSFGGEGQGQIQGQGQTPQGQCDLIEQQEAMSRNDSPAGSNNQRTGLAQEEQNRDQGFHTNQDVIHQQFIVKQEEEQEQEQKEDPKITVFIQTLLHALDCKHCELRGCQKMRLVLGHFLTCGKRQAAEECALCAQLISVVTKHALNPAHPQNSAANAPCPVPMCDEIRAEANQEVKVKTEVKMEVNEPSVRVLTPGDLGSNGRAVRVITAGGANAIGRNPCARGVSAMA